MYRLTAYVLGNQVYLIESDDYSKLVEIAKDHDKEVDIFISKIDDNLEKQAGTGAS